MINTLEDIVAIQRKNMYQIQQDNKKKYLYNIQLDDKTVIKLSEHRWKQVVTNGLKAMD